MNLLDTNILTHYVNGHPTLRAHLQQVPWAEIALPSVVVAEALRGRCEYALKSPPEQAAAAHALLRETQELLRQFQMLVFDQPSAAILIELQKKHSSRKRYADMMIAAMALVGRHVVVTRNKQHFADLLPAHQIANWIDDPA